MDNKCPDCGKPLKCLSGCSAHPSNWYCNDGACGYQAWGSTTTKPFVKETPESKPVVLEAGDSYARCFLKLVAKCNGLQERVQALEAENNLNQEAKYDADA